MRTMLLTGLGSEQSFQDGGETKFFLVFNGNFRVPVTEATAEAIVKEMYEAASGTTETAFTKEEIEEAYQARQAEKDHYQNGNGVQDEDGVDQL